MTPKNMVATQLKKNQTALVDVNSVGLGNTVININIDNSGAANGYHYANMGNPHQTLAYSFISKNIPQNQNYNL